MSKTNQQTKNIDKTTSLKPQSITITGKNGSQTMELWPEKKLKEKLTKYKSNKSIKYDAFIIPELQTRDSSLVNKLHLYSYKEFNEFNISKAIRKLGFKVFDKNEIKNKKPRNLQIKKTTKNVWSGKKLIKTLDNYCNNNNIKNFQFINTKELKQQEPELAKQLTYFNFEVESKLSIENILRSLDFKTRKVTDLPTIWKGIKEKISPEIALSYYNLNLGDSKKTIIPLFKENNLINMYKMCIESRRLDYKPNRLELMINSLYPDIQKKFDGIPLFKLMQRKPHITEKTISNQLNKWFYEKKNISGLEGLGKSGRIVNRAILSKNLSDQLNMDKELGTTPKEDFDLKKLYFLKKNIPSIKISDFERNFSGQQVVSRIAELEVQFCLEIIKKYDSNFEKIPEMRKFFEYSLKEICSNNKIENVTVHGENSDPAIADLRAIINDNKHVMIDVKRHKELLKISYDNILQKYLLATNFQDKENTPIYEKLIIFNSKNNSIDENKTLLEASNFKVMTGCEFSNIYKKSLELILEKDPKFTEQTIIPMTGSTEEVIDKINYVHELVQEYPYILESKGLTMMRDWFSLFLKGAIYSIKNNIKITDNRENLINLQKEYVKQIKPDKHIQKQLNLPKNIEDVVFFDNEQAGSFRRKIKNNSATEYNGNGTASLFKIRQRKTISEGYDVPILGSIGFSYVVDGEILSHILLARDPIEEVELLENTINIFKTAKTAISFSGKIYDIPFLKKRLLAHRIKDPFIEQNITHLDLYADYYKNIAKEKNQPKASLQTYEKVELGIIRKGDIKSSRIPSTFIANYLGNDSNSILKVITHNETDMISPIYMYMDYVESLNNKKEYL